jgi:hypothetical protein
LQQLYYYIIISSAEKHGLEEYEPPPRRVTIRFDTWREQWLIAWSHYSFLFNLPERKVPVDSETALDALCSGLVDLWKETHPDEPLQPLPEQWLLDRSLLNNTNGLAKF